MLKRLFWTLPLLWLSASVLPVFAAATHHVYLYSGNNSAWVVKPVTFDAKATPQESLLSFPNQRGEGYDVQFLPLEGLRLQHQSAMQGQGLSQERLAQWSLGSTVLVPRWNLAPSAMEELGFEAGILKQVQAPWAVVSVAGQQRVVKLEELRFSNLPKSDRVGQMGQGSLHQASVVAPQGGQGAWVYRLGGLETSVRYALILPSGNAQQGRLQGLMMVRNTSEAPLPNSQFHLLAGDSHQVQYRSKPMMAKAVMLSNEVSMDAMASEAPIMPQAEGQLYRFTLPSLFSLQGHQQVEMPFLPQSLLTVKQQYVYDPMPGGVWLAYDNDAQQRSDALYNTEVFYKVGFSNKKQEGTTDASPRPSLGIPLPQGRLEVFRQGANGGVTHLGESNLRHTPVGEEIELPLGKAMDVVVHKRQTAYHKLLFGKGYTVSYEVEVKNQSESPLSVEVWDHPESQVGSNWKVDASSLPARSLSASLGSLVFDVPVAAGKSTLLTYTLTLRTP